MESVAERLADLTRSVGGPTRPPAPSNSRAINNGARLRTGYYLTQRWRPGPARWCIVRLAPRSNGEIRYCYESRLSLDPKLSGWVVVEFIITGDGTVSSSTVVDTGIINASTNDGEFQNCVAERVRTWVFPTPKGRGLVIVTYPFFFLPAKS